MTIPGEVAAAKDSLNNSGDSQKKIAVGLNNDYLCTIKK